ncbi:MULTISPECIES: NAD(P)-dependent oxidoreductase [unclassified Pseudomonas]|uniref:NAD-dependent epimerase/dehydratase family protein n=1 Tax=unclassified Pseudomonas TaxID=196821 RepID=UPI000FB42ACA|nr:MULTISPECIES: NAD(P)-dependent oxidoreductase [unclassified Pseudomonas]MCE5983157.1 NAD(P)-dependent oxidoreductase [Pseudomonas sp. LF19]SPO64370.1 putative Epimerase [Pseudomonas sp. JV241A]
MKILLAGGQSSLAQALQPVLANVAEVLTAGRNGCEVELDLSWPAEQFCLPPGIDVVINTAASFVDGSINALLEAEQINALGTLKLCDAAQRGGVQHFVQISSINAELNNQSDYYGIYGLSKRHADELVQMYCARAKLACTLLRPSQLYGEPDSFRRHQAFIYGTLDKALKNEDIVIYGSHDARRNYLHVEDFCKIVSAVVADRVEGLYTCTHPQDASLLSVANSLVLAANSNSRVSFDASKKAISDNVFPYDDTLYRTIGIYPSIGLEEGLGRLVASRMGER